MNDATNSFGRTSWSNHQVGWLMVVGWATAGGLIPTASKIAFDGAGPYQTLFGRALFAVIGFALLIPVANRNLKLMWATRIPGACLIGYLGMFYLSLEGIPASIAPVAFTTVPAIISVIKFFTKGQQLARLQIVGIAAGMIGVTILVLPNETIEGVSPTHLGLLAISVLLFSLFSLSSEHWMKNNQDTNSTVYSFNVMLWLLIAAAVAAGVETSFRPELFSPTTSTWLAVIVLGLILSTTQQGLLQASIRRIGSRYATVGAYIQPAIATVVPIIVLDEPATLSLAVATLMTVGGAWMIKHFSREARNSRHKMAANQQTPTK